MRGLLAYLLGPGRHTEHVDPRVVAAWQPVEYLLDRPDAPHLSQLGRLTRALEAPVRAVRETMRPAKHVWHCIVQNDRKVDPVLTDEQWATIAAELIDAVGLDNHRWVAVRHDDHGIHIAATLVDEDGVRASLRNEIRRLNACRVRLESRYCRRRTDPGTRTGGVAYRRHEVEEMRRTGARRPVRVQLRNAIYAAALRSSNADEFRRELRRQGVAVGFRYSTLDPTQITGYKVALKGDHNSDGDPVWWKASAIDRSLTWPKIQARWLGQPVDDAADPDLLAHRYTTRIKVAVRQLQGTGGAADAPAGVADLVVALNLTRPAGLSDQAWDDLLDRSFWMATPLRHTDQRRTRTRLSTAARTLARSTLGTRRDAWADVATEVMRAVAAVASSKAAQAQRRQAEHANCVVALLRQVIQQTAPATQPRRLQHEPHPPTPTPTPGRTR